MEKWWSVRMKNVDYWVGDWVVGEKVDVKVYSEKMVMV